MQVEGDIGAVILPAFVVRTNELPGHLGGSSPISFFDDFELEDGERLLW